MRYLLASGLFFGLTSAAAIPTSQANGNGNGNGNDDGDGNGMTKKFNVELGPRPYYLVNDMDEGALKTKLQSCSEGPFEVSDFVFAHRGAPLQFPEHTSE
ncbi:MAG: hypothetical protein Q9204_004970, partial [Flavoplaca sp. TL-2023a]